MKSRNLSAYEYFQMLQIEWMSADIRSKVYPFISDREYWKKVKDGKEKIINAIAEKNMLPTIFTDDEMKRIFERKVYGQKGFPTFSYKDNEHRARQEKFDFEHYYTKGTEVRLNGLDGGVVIGKIKYFDSETRQIEVDLGDGDTITESYLEVSRIL